MGTESPPATGNEGTLGTAAAGLYSVTVQAAVNATTSAQTFTWNVSRPITLTNPGNQTSSEGNTVALSLTAADSTSGTLTYSAVSLPPGLAINPSTGAITGTVAVGAAAGVPYSVTVVAQDGTYRTSQTFTWTVNRPVTLTAPTGQTNNEGDTVSLTLSASDSTSGTLKYTALGLPPGLVLNPNTGAITGTLTVDAAANAPYTVTVAAADGTYSAQTTFTWTVKNPISITDPGVQNVSVDSTVNLQIQSSDSQPGTRSYSAFNLPVGLSINAATGPITGTISNTATAAGTTLSTIKVTDGTYSAVQTIVWNIVSPTLGLMNTAARLQPRPGQKIHRAGRSNNGDHAKSGRLVQGRRMGRRAGHREKRCDGLETAWPESDRYRVPDRNRCPRRNQVRGHLTQRPESTRTGRFRSGRIGRREHQDHREADPLPEWQGHARYASLFFRRQLSGSRIKRPCGEG